MIGNLLVFGLYLYLTIAVAALIIVAVIVAAVLIVKKKTPKAISSEQPQKDSAEEPVQNSFSQAEEKAEEKAEETEVVIRGQTEVVPAAVEAQEKITLTEGLRQEFVAVEESPEPEPVPAPEPMLKEESDLPSSVYEKAKKKFVIAPSQIVNVRYDRSFTARLIQSSDQSKSYFTELKNELLSYDRVKSRTSWRQESFRKGRNPVAKLEFRGKTLCLYLALNCADYVGSKYLVEDVSEKKRNAFTPCMYRIKNDRRLKYAKVLISDALEKLGVAKKESEWLDYAADYPYEPLEPLLERGLVKLIEERKTKTDSPFAQGGEIEIEIQREVSVAVAEDLMDDEVAQVLVQESENVSVRGKQTIVNVDTLGEYFNEGEIVTLDEMRERIPFLNKKAEYVKVLARGVLRKAITVEADDFSLPAVKMIILAGGTVYRKRGSTTE